MLVLSVCRVSTYSWQGENEKITYCTYFRSLRYQASNCPICRAPFIALLQIRVVQKMSHSNHPALAGTEQVPQEGVPPGYNSVSLVEALNGPHNIR